MFTGVAESVLSTDVYGCSQVLSTYVYGCCWEWVCYLHMFMDVAESVSVIYRCLRVLLGVCLLSADVYGCCWECVLSTDVYGCCWECVCYLQMFTGVAESVFVICRCLRVLLEQGVDVNTMTQAGDTPLHLAVDGGHLACCQLLLHHGADVILHGAVSCWHK